MKKERRCLKFIGYVYLPDDNDLQNNNNARSYMMRLGMGRIEFFNEQGEKIEGKAKAFDNLGEMLATISKLFKKRTSMRLRTTYQRNTWRKSDEK